MEQILNNMLLEFATFPRHNQLINSLNGSIFNLIKKKEVYTLQENCILVFEGTKFNNDPKLIDVNSLINANINLHNFQLEIIDKLEFIQPDFMCFKNNKYITGINGLKIVGCPDLVVEVWSVSNNKNEKDWKFQLYSSSDNCEHWYIEQDSNIIKCYKGKEKLTDQNLKNILKSTNNLEFDLRHLSI